MKIGSTILFASVFSVLLCCCSQVVYDTKGFVSREEFDRKFGWGLALPASARQVRARVESRGTQQNTTYMAFPCDLNELDKTVQQWATDSSQSTAGAIHHFPLTNADYEGTGDAPIWWSPRNIQSGYYMKLPRAGGRGIRIWVDQARGISYLYDES